jgi:hypothetical protein
MKDFPELPMEITLGDKYDPAMTVQTPEEAKACFDRLVEHTMRYGRPREEAERVERQNIGYWTGYQDAKTRERVLRLFKATHPVFGHETFSPDDAFDAGMKIGFTTLGYSDVKKLGNEWAGILRQAFTVGLFVGLDAIGYRTRYCYPDLLSAKSALKEWDGKGDPPGPWIKQKPEERLNPNAARDES